MKMSRVSLPFHSLIPAFFGGHQGHLLLPQERAEKEMQLQSLKQQMENAK